MTSTTFFIIFIPILAILLLSINLILAPHNPYQEKDSVFECGFHSFLGQNRTQFSVSFFIFGLLFLLFDLEILLVYPYSVSSYTNDIYGLAVMMAFFVLLTLGFIFELGKNALTIDSRQTSYNNVDVSTPHAAISSALYLQLVKGKTIFGYILAVSQLFSDYLRILKDKCVLGLEWASHNSPKPHAFTSLQLQSSGQPVRVNLTQQQADNYLQLMQRHGEGQNLTRYEYDLIFNHIDHLHNEAKKVVESENATAEQRARADSVMENTNPLRGSILQSVRAIYPDYKVTNYIMLPVLAPSFLTRFVSVGKFILPYFSVLLSLFSLFFVICFLFTGLEFDMYMPEFIYFSYVYIQDKLQYEIFIVTLAFLWSYYSFYRKAVKYINYYFSIANYINTSNYYYLLLSFAIGFALLFLFFLII